MWVMANLKAEDGLEIYLQRMKIQLSRFLKELRSFYHFHSIDTMKNLKQEFLPEEMPPGFLAGFLMNCNR